MKEAVRTGRMTPDEALDELGKSSGFFGKVLKWGGIGAVGEFAVNGTDGIVGGALNTAWTEVGKIEAEQNAIGGWHSLLKNLQEFLYMIGVEWEYLDGKLETHGKKNSTFTDIKTDITQDGQAGILEKTARTVGQPLSGLTGMDSLTAGMTTVGGVAAYKLGGGILNRAKGFFSGSAAAEAGSVSAPALKAGGSAGGLLSRIGSSLKGFGRFGKIATIGTLAAGTTVAMSGGAEASTGDLSVSNEEAASANPSLIENATNGAHAFAHGFVEEISTTGAGLAGHVADAGDWAFGKVASVFGADTGFEDRNLSQNWADSAQGLADSTLGAPDLSSGFAQAMHTTGGVASWFVGPIAFGGAKLANVGASALSKTFAAAGAGTRAQGVAGFTGGIAAPGVAFATVPTVGQP